MRLIKGLVLFCFLGVLISSCFNPPEFRDKPEVIFKDIYYGEDPNGPDSLVLVFDFKDGDGNLGLNDLLVDSPFHAVNFYAEKNPLSALSSQFVFISNTKLGSTGLPFRRPKYYVSYVDEGSKIVTLNSRKNGFGSLPAFTPPYSTCQANKEYYLVDTLMIHATLKSAVDKNKIVDSLISIADNKVAVYFVRDTFYTQVNPTQYNIRVRFFERVGSGFQEFDWRKEFCATYDGRFTVLSSEKGPLEGTITYPMKSSGFLSIFGVKSLYLEFEILDRSLNQSNTERTIEFTLNEIKK